MRSMFWKLFFSLLLAIFLGGGLSVLALAMFGHLSLPSQQQEAFKAMDENQAAMIMAAAEAAVQVYEFGGKTEYRKYLAALLRGAWVQLVLINKNNRDLTGAKADPEQIALAEKARSSGQPVLIREPGRLTVSKRLFVDRDDSPIVVGVRSFEPFLPPPDERIAEGQWSQQGNLRTGSKPEAGQAGQPGTTVQGPGPPPEPPEDYASLFFLKPRPPFFLMGVVIRTTIMLLIIAGVCYYLARSLALPLQKLQQTTRLIAQGDYSARVGNELGRVGNEIADLGREFDIMAERTEKVINAQTRLLRDISHELRSPLARLNVALEIARQHCQAEDDAPLARIGREADRLNELIGQLLTLTRLESGSGLPEAGPIHLGELLAEIAEDVNFEATTRNRSVAIVCTTPVVVFGSRELLHRAFENIIRNGSRFTAPGTRVEISIAKRNDRAVIDVADNGPGVPEADLAHLLEPFYRVAEARERKSGGVGIGLAIAAQAIQTHGGEIALANRSDTSGLAVTVILPLAA